MNSGNVDNGKFNELVEFARQEMERFQIPGVALGLSVNGRTHVAGLGVTGIENPFPVAPETVFQVASITKTFTATCIFRLLELGKLSLDDPLCMFIPNFKVQDETVSSHVTIRHLLNHTSGWFGDYFINTGDGDQALSQYVEKMACLPQITPLGAFYAYNNASFNALGRVVEVLTAKPYEVAVQELLLDPLELSSSYFFPNLVKKEFLARGHYLKANRVIPAHPWPVNRGDAPCGGVGSNVVDLLKYACFHMGNGISSHEERLLRRDSLDLMQTPAVPTEDETSIGLNWFIQDIDKQRLVGHGGSTDGQNSLLLLVPGDKLAFVVLTNLDPGSLLCEELKKWVLERYLGIKEPGKTPIIPSSRQLQESIGRYSMPPAGDVLDLSFTGSNFLLTNTVGNYSGLCFSAPDPYPPIPLAFYAPDRLLVTAGQYKGRKVQLLRREDGKIGWLRFDGRISVRVE
jgi:CubicO group peptidase (beta-lactamase class C family)